MYLLGGKIPSKWDLANYAQCHAHDHSSATTKPKSLWNRRVEGSLGQRETTVTKPLTLIIPSVATELEVEDELLGANSTVIAEPNGTHFTLGSSRHSQRKKGLRPKSKKEPDDDRECHSTPDNNSSEVDREISGHATKQESKKERRTKRRGRKVAIWMEEINTLTTHQLHQVSKEYTFSLLAVSLFYSLPVWQLVMSHQSLLQATGNEDLCYYNFACANRLGKVEMSKEGRPTDSSSSGTCRENT